MIFARPIEPEHIDAYFKSPRNYDKKRLALEGGEQYWREVMAMFQKNGMSQVFLTEECEVVALWFAMSRCEGAMTIFAFMTMLVDRHPLDFIKACHDCLDILHRSFDLHRVEAFVDADYDKSIRWLEHLGFQKEGLLKKYNVDKSDAVIMGRVW